MVRVEDGRNICVLQNVESASIQGKVLSNKGARRVPNASSLPRHLLQADKCFHRWRLGLPRVHTPGPAEKAGKSSKSMMKSAVAPPHEEAVAVSALLDAVDKFEYKSNEKAGFVVS